MNNRGYLKRKPSVFYERCIHCGSRAKCRATPIWGPKGEVPREFLHTHLHMTCGYCRVVFKNVWDGHSAFTTFYFGRTQMLPDPHSKSRERRWFNMEVFRAATAMAKANEVKFMIK